MISLNNTRKAENYNLKETAQKYQELYISEPEMLSGEYNFS